MSDLNNVEKLNPLTRFCMTIGQIPASYLVSMTYEEQLLWLCDYLKNKVIPAVNNNADCVTELQNLYKDLKNYVDNYFDNLNVQEEINNKLDEMIRNGTFANIINNYTPIPQIQNDISNINSDINQLNAKEQNLELRVENNENKINSIIDNNPIPVSSINEMTDTSRIYVNTTDGKWYYYNGTAWEIGGTYQASQDSLSINELKIQANNLQNNKMYLNELDGFHSLTALPTDTNNYNINNYESKLVTSSVSGGCSPIIPIRDFTGRIINDIKFERIEGTTSTAQCIHCFGSDGNFNGSYSQSDVAENGIPANAYFIAYHYYETLPTKAYIKSKNVEWLNLEERFYLERLIETYNLQKTILTENKGTLLNKSFTTSSLPQISNSNIFDFKSYLQDSQISDTALPVVVKNKYGQQIVDVNIINANNSLDASILAEYDYFGNYLGLKSIRQFIETGFNANTTYALFKCYHNANIYPEIKLKNKEVYYVGHNREYNSLCELLKLLKDNENEKTIYIDAGEYDIFQELGGSDFINTIPAGATWREVSVIVPKNTHIVGLGNVTLKFMPEANEITVSASRLLSAINTSASCSIENITIIAKNCRYCIHDETSGLSEFSNSIKNFKNVKAIKLANDTGYGFEQAIATGFDSAMSMNYENCIIESYKLPFSFHNRSGKGSKINISNCAIISDSSDYSLNFGNVSNGNDITEVNLFNCYLNKKVRLAKETGVTNASQLFDLTMIKCSDVQVVVDMDNNYPPKIYK